MNEIKIECNIPEFSYDPTTGSYKVYNYRSPIDILIDEHFGGIPKDEIIEILKRERPENFL